MTVPRTPEEFFAHYVPGRIALLADQLTGKSSVGSVAFRLDGEATWSFRLRDGALEVGSRVEDDAIVQVTAARASFEPIFVRSAERDEATPLTPERRLGAVRALTLDAERAALIRNTRGSVAVVVRDGEREHRIVATPGAQDPGSTVCTLRLTLQDFEDLQAHRVQPLQLVMMGQLVIEGDAQVVLALGAALAG